MNNALDDFFRNTSVSVEQSLELQHWGRSLKKSVDQVYAQIIDVSNNIGMPIRDSSSLEIMEKRMDAMKDKALGLTLLLRNSGHSFEKRFFEMMARVIKSNRL
jgi:hypothetical protein